MTLRPRRSVLYMPGSNARALDKARTLAADALVLDLEDAVAPEQKAVARSQIAAALEQGGYGRRELVVRINALSGPWGRDDLRALSGTRPDAILIPKVSTPADIRQAAAAMGEAGLPAETRLWAMMETPAAILDAPAIAGVASDPATRLTVLVMGTNDLARETRARQTPGRAPMLPWLSTCVLAARAVGLDILDGVFGDINDLAGLRAECEQGRDLGMDGKTLVHPGQLAVCNEVFSPDEKEIAAARKVMAAFDLPENAGKGAISLDGRMVERLHAEIAARILALSDAIGRMNG
jgi:citrate lyase subunit beta/citryl-CoA lyase